MSRVLLGRFVAATLLIAPMSGCIASVDNFKADTCQSVALATPSDDHGQVSAICDLKKPAWLIALPQRVLDVDTFKKAGLSEYVAVALSRRTTNKSQWCVVEMRGSTGTSRGSDQPSGREFDLECADSNIEISDLAVAHSSKFVINVNRRTDGRIVLIAIDKAK